MITMAEADYGAAMLMLARKEKQPKGLPKQHKGGTPESEVPALIIEAIERGNFTATAMMPVVGMGKDKLVRHLYRMRGAGKVHSVQDARNVRWHLGPKEAAA